MKATLVNKDLGLKKIYYKLSNLKKLQVTVGIHDDAGMNKGVSVVEYAAKNHYGWGVPSRPFLAIAFDQNSGWKSAISAAVNTLFEGAVPSLALSDAGKKATDDVQNVIKSSVPPPNSPRTLLRKQGTITLIDTGVMLSKVDYRVKVA